MDNYYNVAGLTIKMNTFGKTSLQAEPYRIHNIEKPDVVISTDGYELEKLWPTLSVDSREYMATGVLFYKALLNYDGMMLHSSAVVVDDRAYLFTANCGTGKSTHTSLWLKLFGDRAFVLNDDKPALRCENGIWYAYGTPWSGKHDISRNVRVPLAGIAVLERGEENVISRFNGIDAINQIIRQVNKPKFPEYRIKMLNNVDKLFREIPIWKLKCNMDPEAAIVSYEAMSGQKLERK